MEDKGPSIIFINQYAGPLFLGLAEDLVEEFGSGELFTGHTDEILRELNPDLTVVSSPKQITSSSIARIISWFRYFLFVSGKLLRKKAPLLFIVSNPPIILWLGYLVQKLRGQRYVVLIYDIFPEMMISFSGLPSKGTIASLWRSLNKLALERADAVFTIGDYMRKTLELVYNPLKTKAGKTFVIPNWAEPDIIRPIPKTDNWFARDYGQIGRLTILYSGTMGLKHNVDAMIQTAVRLKTLKDVHFMFIGRGEGYKKVAKIIKGEGLENTTLLPFLPISELPYSLAVGDIAVIALEQGGEGVYVPSKTYYAMAAGSALIALCSQENELSDIIRSYQCGIIVPPDDVDGFVAAIYRFMEDKTFLKTCRRNARSAVIKFFSREVCTTQYRQIIKDLKII